MSRSGLCSFAVIAALAALAVAGCGGGSDSTSGAGGTSEGTEASEGGGSEETQQFAAEWIKGSFVEPKVPAIKNIPTSENIWIVTVGQLSVSGQKAISSVLGSSKDLGWQTNQYDGKFEQNEWIAGVRAAVAAKADAIFTYAIDCAPIAAALQEAKAAGIPVINLQGVDCDVEGGPKLFTYTVSWNGLETEEFWKTFGEAQASWVSLNEPDAKIISFEETDVRLLINITEGFKSGLEEYCPGCEIVEEIKFTGAELGPKLQSKAEQALLRTPEATVVNGNYDDPINTAIYPAMQNAGKAGEVALVGGEGQVPNIELVYDGIQSAGSGLGLQWEGYAAMDAIIRVLADQDLAGNTKNGLGVQLYDKDNNLPPRGQAYAPDIDYKAAFYKAWGLE